MPFMIGRGAVGRTLKHLQQGQIILNKNIKILMLAFNLDDEATGRRFPHHSGLYNFVFWHLPQLQYKNPDVQMITLNKLTPTPWIRAYFEDDTKLLIDCDSRTREDIHEHVKKVLGIPEFSVTSKEEGIKQEPNPANFGSKFARQCICEVPGHVPCPGWQPLPLEMTGKGRKKLQEQAEG